MKNIKSFIFLFLVTLSVAMLATSCADSKTIRVPVEVAKDDPGAVLVTTPILEMDGTPTGNKQELWVKYMDIEFKPYGFMNKNSRYNDRIEYDWTGGNLFWCIILSPAALIPPVLIIGLNWWEPVALKGEFYPTEIKIAQPKRTGP